MATALEALIVPFVAVASIAIDPPTAVVVAAIIAACGGVAARWAPKTRTEAQVDTSTARLAEAQAWGELVENLRARVDQLGHDLDKDRERHAAELAAERAECDRRIHALEQQVAELRARIAGAV